MGKDAKGKTGDEEAGYAEYAGFDPGVEAEGAWKRLEEVAEFQGEEINQAGWLLGCLLEIWLMGTNELGDKARTRYSVDMWCTRVNGVSVDSICDLHHYKKTCAWKKSHLLHIPKSGDSIHIYGYPSC